MFDAVLPKNTTSPAWSALRETDLPGPYWAAAERGMLMPAWPHAHCIRPEQSKPTPGFSPPHWYGVPRWLSAACMAAPAAPAGPMNVPMLPAAPRACLAAADSLATAALASATALSAASFL